MTKLSQQPFPYSGEEWTKRSFTLWYEQQIGQECCLDLMLSKKPKEVAKKLNIKKQVTNQDPRLLINYHPYNLRIFCSECVPKYVFFLEWRIWKKVLGSCHQKLEQGIIFWWYYIILCTLDSNHWVLHVIYDTFWTCVTKWIIWQNQYFLECHGCSSFCTWLTWMWT